MKPLVTQVYQHLDEKDMGKRAEIIIVDDNSRDGTEQAVEELKKQYPRLRIIVRTNERGLSSAVLKGFNEARGEYLLCMDADLQHPPSKVWELLKCLEEGNEFVIGTRYGKGVSIDEGWPLHRRIISSTARLMARPLTPLSDPMTGFFGITKSAYKKAKNINSIGFKICMELYVKAGIKKHAEIPFTFGVRTEGESKLTGAVIVHYLFHLKDLYFYQYGFLVIVALILAIVLFLFFVSKVVSLIN